MKTALAVTFTLLLALPAIASTTANNDSCDIAVQPAATLLLPYFEVDINAPASTAVNTIFSITNTSPQPQIANVTIWTDWGYPAAFFPIFLTGYDVQPISLYDVLARGIIAPPNGTSINTPVPVNPTLGSQPGSNASNGNFLPDVATACAAGNLPGVVPTTALNEMRSLLTTGLTTLPSLPNSCPGVPVGGTHAHPIGYITIDVVATCTPKSPATPDYYSSILLYDNVLTGDYQVLNRAPSSYALGGPMVHIRAIPGGGAAGSVVATPLPYTFYDRLTGSAPSRKMDRRQPLPATFAARWIQGGPGAFNTSYRIWREPLSGTSATCGQYASNGTIPSAEVVRFDEHENATIVICGGPPPVLCSNTVLPLPVTSTTPTTATAFPPPLTGDLGGWMYLNLNNGSSPAYSVARPSQNWVEVSLFADPTFATQSPATVLGNGCSAAVTAGAQIRPAAP